MKIIFEDKNFIQENLKSILLQDFNEKKNSSEILRFLNLK